VIEGISPHIVHLAIAFLLGGVVMRWRDVWAFLHWVMTDVPTPDPNDPYEDAVHDPTWGDVDREAVNDAVYDSWRPFG
jgi:hypothetical protein